MRGLKAYLFSFIVFSISFLLINCKKNDQILKSEPDKLHTSISKKLVKSPDNLTTTALGRTLVSDAYDASGRIEIKIWKGYVDGEHNFAEVSVDPDFVCIGGGAKITDFNNSTANNNALLTSSQWGGDGLYDSWVANSQDQLITWSHRVWVYAIGIKMYASTGLPLAPAYLKTFLYMSSGTGNYGSSPQASVYPPAGYLVLSGGAYDAPSSPGNMLTKNMWNGDHWEVWGKDHQQYSPSYTVSYILSISNSIPEMGPLATFSRIGHINTNNHQMTLTSSLNDPLTNNTGYVLTGIGAWSDWSGQGRMLNMMYPEDAFTITVGSKDHVVNDLTGGIYSYATGIKKL
ncbi:MAG TPA: hypothetical protein VGC75_01455 [Candidatus Nitrosocosmicus sp.]|jgi:hypothetical protein